MEFIVTKRNYVRLREEDQINAGEGVFGPSITVPNQTMSLRELLDKHSRGMPVSAPSRQAFYDEDGDGVDFDSLDIIDQKAYIQAKREEYNGIKDRFEAEQAELKAKYKARLTNPQTKQQDEPVTKDKGKSAGKDGV